MTAEHKPAPKPLWQRSLVVLSAVVTAALVISALYWMRAVFIPLALAIFLAAVLAPVVSYLQKRRFGRLPAVVVVVVAVVLGTGGLATVVVTQLAGLTETMADNKDHIKSKLETVRTAVFGDGESRWAKIVKEWEQSLLPPGTDSAPQPVLVEPSGAWWARLDTFAGPVAELLGLVAFALVLMVFMLLAKEDLLDRVFRLLGMGAMTSAARAGGETTSRVSRYLFAQFVLNALFGLVCTLGLLALQVPYALLWGLLAFVMRYVPYLGTWIGVLLPATFSAALSDSWFQPIAVLVLFVGLELVSNNMIEPRLYGTSLGVSEVALLVMAAFWTFLWGPIGLVLSGPLTMFLVVVGKHTPQFRFLEVLFGSEPPLTPAESLYQRLTARNQDEAERVVEAAIPKDDPREVFDSTVIPALSMIKQARQDGQLDADDERQVMAIAAEVIEEAVGLVRRRKVEENVDPLGERRVRVLASPAVDEADRLSVEALVGLLPNAHWEVKVTGVATLTSELIQQAEGFNPDVICIAALPPNGISHVRYLCKRLRTRFPDVQIVVGRWGGVESPAVIAQLVESGVSVVVHSLSAARASLVSWLPVFTAEADTGHQRSGHEPVVGTRTANLALVNGERV